MIIEKNGKPYAVPRFNYESAKLKVKTAEDAWNSKDPERVALGYTQDSDWRNRSDAFSKTIDPTIPGLKDRPLPAGSYWFQKGEEAHVTKCLSHTDCQ